MTSVVLKSLQASKASDASAVIAGAQVIVLISIHCIDLRMENSSTTQSPVGASLLAMAEYQATLMLDMPASSRASSLPQGYAVTRKCRFTVCWESRTCASEWR